VASPKDVVRLAVFLHLGSEEFILRYAERTGEKVKIRTADTGRCIFFIKDAGCAVHEAKPDICRAWPFFRGNILDSESLYLAKDFCPGISPQVSHEDFARRGRAYLHEHNLVASDPSCEAAALILP
jgi:Fe-S-cluster containining protein